MQKGLIAILMLIGVLVIILVAGGFYYTQIVQPTKPENSSNKLASIPNPADLNCEQKGGKLESRSTPSRSHYGVCKFNDGTECGAWAYFNGNCKPGQYKNWEENIDKQPDLKISFYSTGFTTSITDQADPSASTKNSWTEKEDAKYLFLGITVQNTSNFSSTSKEATLKVVGDINKEITIPALRPGQYSQNIPLFVQLPPQNSILRLSVNEDKSISESDYYNDYIFVSLKEGTTMTERLSSDKTFDFEKQIAAQLTCEDLKLINRLNDFPNCTP